MSIVEAEEDIGEKGSWLGSKDSNLDCMIQIKGSPRPVGPGRRGRRSPAPEMAGEDGFFP